MGRQGLQALCRRKFQIHAHTIRQETGLPNQFLACPRYRLHMDIPLEMMLLPQTVQGRIEQFHRIVRAVQNSGTKEQSFDIIPPIELHRKRTDLFRRKGSAGHVITPSVDAILTVKDTLIRKKNLKQGNTPSVRRETMADPRQFAAPNPSSVAITLCSAGGTCHVILGGIRQNIQFFIYRHTLPDIVCLLCQSLYRRIPLGNRCLFSHLFILHITIYSWILAFTYQHNPSVFTFHSDSKERLFFNYYTNKRSSCQYTI